MPQDREYLAYFILDGAVFRITSARLEGGWALVSVAAFDVSARDPHAPDLGNLGRLVIANQLPDGSWQAALDGDPGFAALAAQAPIGLLSPDAKRILVVDAPTINTAAAVNYKFPWPAGQAWSWWQGWHYSGLDLGITGADQRVLASAHGTITSVYSCWLSTIVDITHADGTVFRYTHLDKGTVNTSRIISSQHIGYTCGSFPVAETSEWC